MTFKLGAFNTLPIVDFDDNGAYLPSGEEEGDIFLPRAEIPPGSEIGTQIEVFVYLDTDDLLIATTKRPLATVGEFAVLRVTAIERVGAFLDWGLGKELLLPFREQTRDLKVGENVIVALYIDKSDRISASMRLQRYVSDEKPDYKLGQEVDLLIASKTELGYKALVNGKHFGLLFANEVFQPLRYAQRTKGFVKSVRPDGKIDLLLSRIGRKAATDDIAPAILERLKEEGGFLEINDKTSAEKIHELFGVSRKKFKIALGGLYKRREITVDEDGIRLAQS